MPYPADAVALTDLDIVRIDATTVRGALASRFGDDNGDGTTFVPIRISRSECARLLGATIETTIRTFSRWQKAALVETTPDGFTLRDTAVLTELTRT